MVVAGEVVATCLLLEGGCDDASAGLAHPRRDADVAATHLTHQLQGNP